MNLDSLIGNLGEHTLNGLALGAIYALVALGYTLVYGVLRLINFAHSEVFMVGTWTVLGVWSVLGVSGAPGLAMFIPLALAGLLVAAVASGTVAVAIERVAYRPLRKRNAPPLIFLITAIGVSAVLVETFGFLLPRIFDLLRKAGVVETAPPFGRELVSTPRILDEKVLFAIGGVEVKNIHLILIGAAIAMMVGLDYFVNHSRLGRGVRAVAQDPDTAALMGVNKDRVIMLVFLLGGIMAGGAALLYNLKYSQTKFDIGFLPGIKAFTAAVLGGIGNLRGALVGGLLLGIVEVYFSTLYSSNWQDVAAFIVLVAVLMFRPTGILGESLGRARA